MRSAIPIVVVAPDSLKGSCSSPEAVRAIAAGVREAFCGRVEVRELPMADGGEGTLDALVSAWGGRVIDVPTTDALGRARLGRVGFSRGEGRRAIIEAADANGLPHVSDQPLRPLDADSAGVGDLVLAAVAAGCDEVLLCLGGSATNDGGAGMLRRLGAKLLDKHGREVASGARGLAELEWLDLAGLDPRLETVRWRIACDVDNPLTGPRGAAQVFGPQKGASEADIALIDAGLTRLAGLLVEASRQGAHAEVGSCAGQRGCAVAEKLGLTPGMGAAGGLALGLVAHFGAELVPGAELVSEAIGLRAALEGAAFVITAEGRLDAQSLDGKVLTRVLTEAGHAVPGRVTPGRAVPGRAVPALVIAGEVALTAAECRAAGIAAAISIARGPATREELQSETPHLLAEAAAQLSGAIRVDI